MELRAIQGGGIYSGTTSPVCVDVSALIGKEVSIQCPTQDVYFCGSETNTTAIVVTATAASKYGLIADRAPAGLGKVRKIVYPFLILRTVSGADLITVKAV
jgi:hypothetical protein